MIGVESTKRSPRNVTRDMSTRDMSVVTNRIADLGGGMVAASEGELRAEVGLRLLGLLSDEPMGKFLKELDAFYKSLREFGCTPIGVIKICDEGLLDVPERKMIDVLAQ